MGHAILPWYAGILVAVILARELIISGFRLVAAGKNKVISADKSGKFKTFFTDLAILFILAQANFNVYALNVTGTVLLIISTALTVYSGIECIVKNIEVIKENK